MTPLAARIAKNQQIRSYIVYYCIWLLLETPWEKVIG